MRGESCGVDDACRRAYEDIRTREGEEMIRWKESH
jgi:hypothetical protein